MDQLLCLSAPGHGYGGGLAAGRGCAGRGATARGEPPRGDGNGAGIAAARADAHRWRTVAEEGWAAAGQHLKHKHAIELLESRMMTSPSTTSFIHPYAASFSAVHGPEARAATRAWAHEQLHAHPDDAPAEHAQPERHSPVPMPIPTGVPTARPLSPPGGAEGAAAMAAAATAAAMAALGTNGHWVPHAPPEPPTSHPRIGRSYLLGQAPATPAARRFRVYQGSGAGLEQRPHSACSGMMSAPYSIGSAAPTEASARHVSDAPHPPVLF